MPSYGIHWFLNKRETVRRLFGMSCSRLVLSLRKRSRLLVVVWLFLCRWSAQLPIRLFGLLTDGSIFSALYLVSIVHLALAFLPR